MTMFKALLRKQFRETLGIYVNPNTGKKKKNAGSEGKRKGKVKGFVVLYIFVLFSLAMAFVGIGHLLGDVLIPAGFGWLFFAFTGLMALAVGVVGSVFGVYSGIYKAKDNEYLLSMPIPPKMIVFVRLIASWAVSLIMEITVLTPCFIVYAGYESIGAKEILCWILLVIAASFICLALTCLVGWVVAFVASKVKNKSIISALAGIAFIALYYVFYFNVNKLLAKLVENAFAMGESIQQKSYPLYAFGKAFTGDILLTLVVAAIAALLFAASFVFISGSFISVATSNKGSKSGGKNAAVAQASKLSRTLVKREFKHYLSSASYIMNCSLGTIFMVFAAVALVIKAEDVRFFMQMLPMLLGGYAGLTSVAIALLLGLMASMNDLTSPSIALEGDTLWILRTIPIDMGEVINAKIRFHLLLTLPSLAVLLAAIQYVLMLNWVDFALISVCAVSYVFLEAYGGIAVNIKMPGLDWVNETAAVKQSGSVAIALFGGWVLCILEGVICYLLRDAAASAVMLGIIGAVNLAAVLAIGRWLKSGGAKALSELQC